MSNGKRHFISRGNSFLASRNPTAGGWGDLTRDLMRTECPLLNSTAPTKTDAGHSWGTEGPLLKKLFHFYRAREGCAFKVAEREKNEDEPQPGVVRI